MNQPKALSNKNEEIDLNSLKQYDGRANGPIYVGICGNIYDVSEKRDVYGEGKGYSIFTGHDASRALAMSSLKVDDLKYEGEEGSLKGLTDKQFTTLKQWEEFFGQRYKIVGKIPLCPYIEDYEDWKKRSESEQSSAE